jgi:hypothetical protein
VFREYADEHRPLGGYAAIALAFNAALGAGLAAAIRRDRLPERVGAADLAVGALATYKLSRLIAKDEVTSPLRAPFARFEGSAGRGEVSEEPRGRGLRLAVGELVTCPYCVGQWVAGGFVLGLGHAPRPTRALAGMWAILGLADFLQLARSALESD